MTTPAIHGCHDCKRVAPLTSVPILAKAVSVAVCDECLACREKAA